MWCFLSGISDYEQKFTESPKSTEKAKKLMFLSFIGWSFLNNFELCFKNHICNLLREIKDKIVILYFDKNMHGWFLLLYNKINSFTTVFICLSDMEQSRLLDELHYKDHWSIEYPKYCQVMGYIDFYKIQNTSYWF